MSATITKTPPVKTEVVRNKRAGQLVCRERTNLGLTPEAMAFEIYAAGYGSVSGRTIRRIEAVGMVPRVRAQFAIAKFLERDVTAVWPVS